MTMNQHGRAAEPSAPVDERAAAAGAAHLFRALGDPGRIAILRHLQLGEHRVVELTAHLGLAQSTVSTHLTWLRECGLVEVEPVGRSSVYRLSQPELLECLFADADQLLEATGHDDPDHHDEPQAPKRSRSRATSRAPRRGTAHASNTTRPSRHTTPTDSTTTDTNHRSS